MRVRISLPPETRAPETTSRASTPQDSSQNSGTHSLASSPSPPTKLYLKLRYPPLPPEPRSASDTLATDNPTVAAPRITTLRALACLTINSLVFAATLVSKSDTPAAFPAARLLVDQAQQFGDIGDELQVAYDSGSRTGDVSGKAFTDSLGELFEAVFFSMAMLKHELNDSAAGAKIAEEYEDAFHQLSAREEGMDGNEEDEFVPTGFGFTGVVYPTGSLSDEWPNSRNSLTDDNFNINSWCRLALLAIAAFQFSAALAEKLGATDDATFLAQQAACLENMGESIRRQTNANGETFYRTVERVKPYVFGVLSGLWEEYKNDDDDTGAALGQEIGYIELYEGLKPRLGALDEPEGSGDSISEEETEEEPDYMSMEELDNEESPDEYIGSDTTQKTEKEFSETLDNIAMLENVSTGLGGDDTSELREMPMGISDELGEAPMNIFDVRNELRVALSESRDVNEGGASDSDLSEIPLEEPEAMIMVESDDDVSPLHDSNNNLANNGHATRSRTRCSNRKSIQTDDKSFECNECHKTYMYWDSLKKHKQHIHDNTDKPQNCNDCDKGFWSRHQLERHQLKHADNYLKCSICGKTFSKKYKLTEHQRGVHNETHACDECDRSFGKKDNLVQHQRNVHAGKKDFECSYCGQKFSQKHSMEAHKQSLHAGERSHRCEECGISFAAKGTLDQHQRAVHTGERPFECTECDQAFKTKAAVTNHQLTIHAHEKPYACKEFDCGMSFKTETSHNNHQRAVHNSEKSVECADCDRRFFSVKGMKDHYRNVHSDEKPFECTDCDKKFPGNKNLKDHRRNVHFDEKPHKCDHCDSKFPTKSRLRQHQQTHSNERLFKCDECGSTFKTKRGFKDHQVVYSDEKPFECEVCCMKFAWRGTLRDHCQTAHTNERPYECNNDSMEFAVKGGLRQHQRICKGFKGPQPFNCIECGAGYAIQTSLRRHQRRVHETNSTEEDENEMSDYRGQEREDGLVASSSRRSIDRDPLVASKKGQTKCQPFVCDSCGKPFAKRDRLVKHEVFCKGSEVSESEMDDEVGMDVDGSRSPDKATIEENTSGKRFQCDCSKSYARHDGLLKHQRTCGSPTDNRSETSGRGNG